MYLNIIASSQEAYYEEKKSVFKLLDGPFNDLLFNEDYGTSRRFKIYLNESFQYPIRLINFLFIIELISGILDLLVKIYASYLVVLFLDELLLGSEYDTKEKFKKIDVNAHFIIVCLQIILYLFINLVLKKKIEDKLKLSIQDNFNNFIFDNIKNIDCYQTDRFGIGNIVYITNKLCNYIIDYIYIWVNTIVEKIIDSVFIIYSIFFSLYLFSKRPQVTWRDFKLLNYKAWIWLNSILMIIMTIISIGSLLLEIIFTNLINNKNENFFMFEEKTKNNDLFRFILKVVKIYLNYFSKILTCNFLLILNFCGICYFVYELKLSNMYKLIIAMSVLGLIKGFVQTLQDYNSEIGLKMAIGTIYLARNISYLFDSFQKLLIKDTMRKNLKIESQLDSIIINLNKAVSGKYIKFSETIDLTQPNVIVLTGNEVMALGLFDAMSGISTDKIKTEDITLVVNKGDNNQVKVPLVNCNYDIFYRILYTHPKVVFPNIVLENLIKIYCPNKEMWSKPLQTVCLDKEISTYFFYLYLSGGQKSRYSKFWNILQPNEQSLKDKNKVALLYHISQGLDSKTTKQVIENLINYDDINTKIIYMNQLEVDLLKQIETEVKIKIIELPNK